MPKNDNYEATLTTEMADEFEKQEELRNEDGNYDNVEDEGSQIDFGNEDTILDAKKSNKPISNKLTSSSKS